MKKAFAIVCCCLLLGAALCGCKKAEEPQNDVEIESGCRRTTLYYLSNEGFLVPVMKNVPWEEGIGRAALSYLVGGGDNDLSAMEMGLKTVIPEGTELKLSIDDDKVACLDLVGLTAHETEAEERAMVMAIVNTLSEFDSIESVKLTVDGKNVSALPNGTSIKKAMTSFALNAEGGEVAVSTDSAHAMTLYFPTRTASLNVPVTRYVSAAPSFSTAVEELVRGAGDERLLDCFPGGTALKSAYISDGIAHVDLSEAFCNAAEVEGMLEAARDSLYLTANGFEPVYGVDIYVDGEEYSLHTAAASAPVYVNEFR